MFGYSMLGFGAHVQGGGAPVAYDPGMMTFDGSTGYYSKASLSLLASRQTIPVRIKIAPFTGGGTQVIANGEFISGAVFRMFVFSSDHATTAYRNKVRVFGYDSSVVKVYDLASTSEVVDSTEHFIAFGYDSVAGSGYLYVDGVDDSDVTQPNYTAPTTGTIANITTLTVGAKNDGTLKIAGDLGYFGYHSVYVADPTVFYHPTNGLQELDESGWTEWTSQPLFWNQYATMTDNKGSGGNMTANGTITGPA